MATYTTHIVIPEDRNVKVELPEDMPTGEAELTVSTSPGGMNGAEAVAWLERERQLHPRTWAPRSRAEIDAEIQALRDEWDDGCGSTLTPAA